MRSVLLVNPNRETAPYPVAPVGLSLVAASIADEFEVHLYDGTFEGPGQLQNAIAEHEPDIIGVGIRNIDDVTMDGGRYYIDDIKRDYIDAIRAASKAPLVLGGSGYSLFPEQLLSALGADFGVIGEGEATFLKLLRALATGADPSAIPGVLSATGTRDAPVTGVRSRDPLELPFSRVDRFAPFDPYRARGTYPIQTKRGCHLKCVYCAYPVIEGRAYRLRSPAAIVDEIEDAAARLGDVVFEFVDSTFNAPPGHAEAICQEIIDRGLTLKIRSMGLNPGAISKRLLALMRRAGFVQIVCSADTASAIGLKRMGKGFTKSKLESAATLIREFDMPTMWSFIFGGPGETEQTIDESFEFIERFVFELDMVHMTEGIRVYPRTPIHAVAVEEGVVSANDDLLRPTFYVSPALGRERLGHIIRHKAETHPNCIRNADSSPSPKMIQQAMALRKVEGLDEPMFRTLLRIEQGQGA